MKKHSLFGAILSTAMVTVTGAALAAGAQPGIGSGTGGSGTAGMMSQAAPAKPGAEPTVTTPSRSGEPSAMQPALPQESVVGKAIVNAEGDKIGEVTKIAGDQVIVSVGGFLGLGTHDVALRWNQIKTTGSGDDMKLETTLTKDELKNMPEYKE